MKSLTLAFPLALLATLIVASAFAAGSNSNDAKKLFDDGNYQEALAAFQKIVDDDSTSTEQLVSSFQLALNCYTRLNRSDEIDGFREAVVSRDNAPWQLLAVTAYSYYRQPHYGYEIAGKFHRGQHRGGGKVLDATARDRVRSIQLYRQAIELLEQDVDQQKSIEAAKLFDGFAETLLHGNGFRNAWRLQILTEVAELPDYEEGWGHRSNQPQGAPVDADGRPIFYDIPPTWEDAKSDGERWRWLLEESVQWQPERRNHVRMTRARFLESQFGVQTLASYGRWFGGQTTQDKPSETGTFALHTLADNETIARLATGIKRFELPDNQNPIKLYEQVLEDLIANHDSNFSNGVANQLATTFENRRQYDRAAETWRMALEKGKAGVHVVNTRKRLDQIVKNWGRFEGTATQPAGKGATVDFRFRNGKRVDFVARKIRIRQLLADVKELLKSSPKNPDWNHFQLENLGHRLVTENQEKYLGEEAARWNLNLEPLEKHFDRRITVATPLQEPGAYLLTSKMADGNETHIILWLNDTAIVRKPLARKSLYYVADAVSGRPIAGCNVEFFGFRNDLIKNGVPQIQTKDFAEYTNENGLVELPADENNRKHTWVAIATTAEGRFAFHGFRNVWSGKYFDQPYQQVKVFSITDRPVYRPEQSVQFKFWVRHAQYDLKDESRFAGKSFQVEIRDPKNEKVHSELLVADAYGGLEGSWKLPAGATLGQYRIYVVNHGGSNFRVEEYKKPEFEVTVDAPTEPVALGEKITATISAKYYFGSPVASGTVKYKILRTAHTSRWYPRMAWDWLYGPGYWWFASDYDWYPGWSRWGCSRPSPWWFWQSPAQPEVVAEREVALGADGTIEVEIDTSVAAQFHPDQDHSYQIQVEVVDESRRTIVGSGRVLVARKPFRVYVWTDRGHYRAGDTIALSTAARTLDGKPVVGTGALRLLKIQYPTQDRAAQPIETEVGRWELPTSESGEAKLQVKASEPGQYRLSYELTDAAGHAIEGGQMLTIAGDGFDGSDFQFSDLEIVPDQRDYQAGDQAVLQINTNRTGAAVLLFLRPANGVYLPPRLIQIEGKSKLVEIDVTAKDTPNFYVEAVTVHGGKVHTVSRELFVPPAKRVLNVEVVPSSDAYLPGQAAKIVIKLTDNQGEPFVGSLVLAMYDKAVEYISGGTNVADIRDFFWKWRRQHQPSGESNLQRFTGVLVNPNDPHMQSLGLFGGTVVDELVRGRGGGPRSGNGVYRQESKMSLGFEFSDRRAMPMAAASAPLEKAEADLSSGGGPSSGVNEMAQPTVRQKFADTALWVGALETSAEGLAEVKLEMPENLTTWKLRVWGMGHGTRVGEGSAEVVTRKNIIVRLQAPRFFVETDEVVLSANVHNYLAEAKQIRVQLVLSGDTLVGPQDLEQLVDVPAGGEQRVDWRVKVAREGTATIRMSALTDEESDAVEMDFPVYVHGMLKTDSYTGVLRPEETVGKFTIDVPTERRAEQTRLEIRYTPTLAGAMVDALPYLIDYPHGCTEQTLNRFLPAVVTQRTLKNMGLDLATIRDKRTNLNSQEIGDDRERAQGWKRFDRNPVFDEKELDKIVKAGADRLTQMQLSDGGWGWFSGTREHSSAHTTAVVVHGLLVAKENGVAIVPDVLDRGIAWLENYQAEQIRLLGNWKKQKDDVVKKLLEKQLADNLDALVYMVLIEAKHTNMTMRSAIYRDRTHLAVYSLATFGIALQNEISHANQKSKIENQTSEMLAMVVRNLGQYVRQDDENQTAWLELPNSGWWHWYGSEYEAHAYYLKLLAATEPKSEIAPRLVKYLLNNRRHATYWNSTRDTALVVEAFADYLRVSGEDAPDVAVEVWVDGKRRKQVTINRENLFSFDNKLVLAGEQLSAGKHTVELRKQGNSPIYYNGYLTNFTLEDHIGAAGLEIKVSRSYYLLTPAKKSTQVAGGRGQVVDERVEKYDRTELVNFAELQSGDLVEVELTIDSKNDYEYILLEDMKAAGFEPVDVRSGYNGNQLGAYMELRDDRVSLFVTRLARGKHSISYRLRAEIPGSFSALPTRASAMYAPELKANSEEIKLRIVD